MALPQKINNLPAWSLSKINRWADYIELCCINNADHIFSIDDLVDHYLEENGEHIERGENEHSEKYDALINDFEKCFEQINFRSQSLKENYPFDIDPDGNSLSLKAELTEYHLFYFFLLFASHPGIFKDRCYELTHAFEDLSCAILREISPKSAVVHIFGTSRHDDDKTEYKGNLRSRLKKLASNIFAVTAKTFDDDPQFDVPAGDGGIDLVSFLALDEAPFIPLAFGQCACSYDDWVDKQTSISYDRWRSRFSYLAPFLQYMFVPFYCRRADGTFEHPADISTCLIDRHRILKIFMNSETSVDDFTQHSIHATVLDLVG